MLGITVYFSPFGGATRAVVDAIGGARASILVQAYAFTSAPIVAALISAGRNGIAVQVILDHINLAMKYSVLTCLARTGIPVFVDHAHPIAHNKVMIIDGSKVVTGSFNFTGAAETGNAENLLIIEDVALASVYAGNWHAHAAHSLSAHAPPSYAPVIVSPPEPSSTVIVS